METPLITLQQINSPQHLESYCSACLALIREMLSSQSLGKLEALTALSILSGAAWRESRPGAAGWGRAMGCGTARPALRAPASLGGRLGGVPAF